MNLLKRRTYILSTVVILFALYALFDGYINNIAKESLANWLMAEEFSIAEGNLLTSVTKNQRMMLSSEFIKGVALLDFTKKTQMEQIEFGEKIDSRNLKNESGGIVLKRVGLFHRYIYAKIPNQKNMIIVFSVWSQGLLNVFVIACALFISLFIFYTFIIELVKKREYRIREKQTIEYANKAARAAHDIRSPLTVLNSLVAAENQGSPEFKQQLARIIESLTDVTQDLVDGRAKIAKSKSTDRILIKPLLSLKQDIEVLIENKKTQYSRAEIIIESDIAETFGQIKLDRTELRRALSNILDNSFDAIEGGGKICFKSYEKDNSLYLEIADSGKGIPQSVLASIGDKGFTFGKVNGSGMGVHYTKENIKIVGGTFKIESKENVGTNVSLRIPIFQSKTLSSKVVELEKNSKVFVLDDDPLIRKTWEQFFKKNQISDSVDISYFSNPEEVLAIPNHGSAFLFTDFDLKDQIDGLDVVTGLGLERASLLVTGRADDDFVKSKAAQAGIHVLSKDRLQELKILII